MPHGQPGRTTQPIASCLLSERKGKGVVEEIFLQRVILGRVWKWGLNKVSTCHSGKVCTCKGFKCYLVRKFTI